MKEVLFTFPGKVGDNLLRLPVAYQYCKQNNVKTDICLDTKSPMLYTLFRKQKWVNNVFIDGGVWDYSFGGQPYDFRKDKEFKKEYSKVFHTGFITDCYGNKPEFFFNKEWKEKYETVLRVPTEQTTMGNITLISAIQSGCNIDLKNLLIEPSIEFEQKPIKNLCIHIKTETPERYIESKETILNAYNQIIPIFDKIYIIGLEKDKEEYSPFLNYTNTFIFDDGGDLNKTVDILSESILIGTYGSMWALANCMKIKQIIIQNNSFNMYNWNTYASDKKVYDKEKWVIANDTQNLLDTLIKLKK